jgi:hypothetical protein
MGCETSTGFHPETFIGSVNAGTARLHNRVRKRQSSAGRLLPRWRVQASRQPRPVFHAVTLPHRNRSI